MGRGKAYKVEHTGRGGRALESPTGADWRLSDRSHETAAKLVDRAVSLYWRNRVRIALRLKAERELAAANPHKPAPIERLAGGIAEALSGAAAALREAEWATTPRDPSDALTAAAPIDEAPEVAA